MMENPTFELILGAINHFHEGRYISAESSLATAREQVYRMAYNIPDPTVLDAYDLEDKGIIYLGLFGTYPIDETDEDQLMARKASEGTKKISDLMDKFVIELSTLQDEYSDAGATDTSAREHIFEKLYDRYCDRPQSLYI